MLDSACLWPSNRERFDASREGVELKVNGYSVQVQPHKGASSGVGIRLRPIGRLTKVCLSRIKPRYMLILNRIQPIGPGPG